MKDVSVQRMGGVGALLVALFSALFSALVLLAPQEVLEPGTIAWSLVLSDYALALVGLFGLAAVPALTERVAPLSPGWMRWTSSLALLGFGLLAVLNLWQAEYEMATDDASFNVPAITLSTLDVASPSTWSWDLAIGELAVRAPRGWLEVAGVGLWIFSVSALARHGGLFPGMLSALGIVAGVLSFYPPVGALLQLEPLQMLGFWSSMVLNPLWFAWSGVVLLRTPPQAVNVPVAPPRPEGAADGGTGRRPPKRRRWSYRHRPLDLLLWPQGRSKP